jgi:hypothetical protein
MEIFDWKGESRILEYWIVVNHGIGIFADQYKERINWGIF